MNSSELATAAKLLFLRRRLIFATTQPRKQHRSITMNVTTMKNPIPQTTRDTDAPATTQWTTTVGIRTVAAYIVPMR